MKRIKGTRESRESREHERSTEGGDERYTPKVGEGAREDREWRDDQKPVKEGGVCM